MSRFEQWEPIDLMAGPKKFTIKGGVFAKDAKSHRLGLIVSSNHAPVTMTGTIQGIAKLPPHTGNSIEKYEFDGVIDSSDSSRVYVDVPAEALYYPGQLTIAIRNNLDNARTVLATFTGWVDSTTDGIPGVPPSMLPDNIEDFIAELSVVRQEIDGALDEIEAKGEEVLASIPQDYTSLSQDVSDLKSAINSVDKAIGTEFITLKDGAYIFTGQSVGQTVTLTETANSSFAYAICNVTPGDIIIINGVGSGNAYLWSFIDSENILLSKDAGNTTGSNLLVEAPLNSAKIIINSTVAGKGDCYIGRYIKDVVKDLSDIVQTEHLITASDVLYTNSNFFITNGTITYTNNGRPFNSLSVKASKIRFKYTRQYSNNDLYFGVSVDGKFVGEATRTVKTSIVEIDGQSVTAFPGAVLITSTGDSNYSATPNEYEGEILNGVVTLKKEGTTIFKFSLPAGTNIEGFSFLNYNSQPIADCTIIQNNALSMVNDLYLKVGKYDLTGKNKAFRLVAGVIRNGGNGWEFIVDSGHQGDLNCASVSANSSGQIVIDYSGIGAKKTISLLIAPDETFARAGYICGASVGSSASYVEIYKYAPVSVCGYIECKNDGTIEIDSNTSSGITSATWDSENNRMHIVHSTVSASACPVAIPALYSTTIPRIYSSSGTSTDIQFINISDGTTATEVTNKLSFRFQRTSPNDLQLVKQDANGIVSQNGNFWFIGIFEV